jgi:hypothetical protein
LSRSVSGKKALARDSKRINLLSGFAIADGDFNQEVDMQLNKLFSICLLGGFIAGCNESTQPSSKGGSAPDAVNSITTLTATHAGYSVSPRISLEIPPGVIDGMRAAGICEDFISLYLEIMQNPYDSAWMFSPRFHEAVACVADRAQQRGGEFDPGNQDVVMNDVQDCICHGKGLLFPPGFTGYSGYQSPVFTGFQPVEFPTYAPPSDKGYRSPSTGDGYASPNL